MDGVLLEIGIASPVGQATWILSRFENRICHLYERITMNRCVILMALCSMLPLATAHAKRAAPAKVTPVAAGKIEYRAPANQMGCVEAWDMASKEMIWRRQVYVVKYQVDLERDVQDVFITVLAVKDKSLIVSNERKSEYELDLDTLQVKVLKGALVETR